MHECITECMIHRRNPGRTYCTYDQEKTRKLKLLAFDEYCRFDISAFFMRIKRASLYTHKESRNIKTAVFIELTVPTSERSVLFSIPIQI